MYIDFEQGWDDLTHTRGEAKGDLYTLNSSYNGWNVKLYTNSRDAKLKLKMTFFDIVPPAATPIVYLLPY